MELVHFTPRSSELSNGIMIVRARRALDAGQIAALFAELEEAGMVFAPRGESGEVDYPADSAQLIALSWSPASPDDADDQRAALEDAAERFGLDLAWFVQIDTCIDSAVAAAMFAHEDEEDDDEESEDEVVDAWRNGPPPRESAPAFPVEGYPEIIDEIDWDDFGIALKLGGPRLAGEEVVVRAFHGLWQAAYHDLMADEHEHGEDEQCDHYVPFRHADVEWDDEHRSCMLWVDRFATPATADEVVHHMLWVASRLGEVIPVVHARFGAADPSWKYRALTGDDTPAFVLAGNPLRARYHEDGEEALAWADAQGTWSRREVAAMLAELVEEHDPDDADQQAAAIRLCERALALDPEQRNAAGFLVQLLVWSRRFDDALARTRASGDPQLAAQLLQVTAAHAPARLAEALAATPPSIDIIEDMASVASDLGRSEEALAVYRRLLEMPLPDDEEARVIYQRCANNACVIAHALGRIDDAVAIAEAARPWAAENPYIFHAAACAYVAAGELDRAFAQVELAVAHGYERLDQMEHDSDLGPLLEQPRFKMLFTGWHAGANPAVEVGDDDFDEQVIERSRQTAVLVDFWADWCGPCRMLGPVLEQVAREHKGRLVLAKVDVDANHHTAARYQVSSIPAVKLFIGGQEVDEFVGAIPAARVREFLSRHLADKRD